MMYHLKLFDEQGEELVNTWIAAGATSDEKNELVDYDYPLAVEEGGQIAEIVNDAIRMNEP